ncbi:MAG: HU family DNA-binding protein [Gemmatimonadota bacterium]
MNKTDLIAELARTTSLSAQQARAAVDALFSPENGVIVRSLQRRRKVQITGFGTFETRRRAARMGRNPQTGAPIRVGAMTSVAFRAGKGLRDAVQ